MKRILKRSNINGTGNFNSNQWCLLGERALLLHVTIYEYKCCRYNLMLYKHIRKLYAKSRARICNIWLALPCRMFASTNAFMSFVRCCEAALCMSMKSFDIEFWFQNWKMFAKLIFLVHERHLQFVFCSFVHTHFRCQLSTAYCSL